MSEKTKESGGGRLNRSQTVTVRLDPRLNYLCELGARVQRRTKSSFIEASIASTVEGIVLVPRETYEDNDTTIGDLAETLWHVREYERLMALAKYGHHLMTMEEQEIWAVICENGNFWRGKWKPGGDGEVWSWEAKPENLVKDRVAESWNEILQVANGETEAAEALLKFLKRRARKQTPDQDDEIPF